MSNTDILDAAEKTIDVVESQLDAIEAGLPEVVEKVVNNKALLVGVGFAGLVIGAGGGYFATRKYLTTKYDQLLEEELADARAYYNERYKRANKAEELATVSGAAEELLPAEVLDALRSYDGHGTAVYLEETDTDESTPVINDILVNSRPIEEEDYDFSEELDKRDRSKPYILSHDEFFENDTDWPQISLTYYEEDDTLVDDHDAPIREYQNLIGVDTLRFGHMSKDRNMVYIANEKTEQTFEIARSEGSFAREVLGFKDKPVPRKAPRRGDDE